MKRIFNHKDFDIETEVDIGHDDFVYGNYVDWDRFRQECEIEILEYFEIYLPWGKEISIEEYFAFISQDCFTDSSMISDFSLDSLPVQGTADSISEIVIEFPRRNRDMISAIFDYHEVPSGFEQEYELPEELQYWPNIIEEEYDEYDYYMNNPI
ncbi:hypothetical protein LI951_14825 [Enterococcus sp. BWT-B8]|uniref:hypothetical protein n=1 Tax=Enterococcus sp. BWT-B8 TaxID=2885157 RepID=UPI001E594E15|nr:hypothetical protein [Enterococcus sp. BWT-B8]MCB5953341.1 hypothetical protein [Enterococcus sp. BWT-B8]